MTTLSNEDIYRALLASMPDRPRLRYVVPDGWYQQAIEAFKDLPVDVIRQSETLLPTSLV